VFSGSIWCCLLSVGCDGAGVTALGLIECVFETDLVELDAAGTLAAADANEHALIAAEIRRLQIAAHWGDLHPGEGVAVIDIRRSKAIGILAQPAQALQLLCQHQHDDWDGPAEPADCDAEPSALQLTARCCSAGYACCSATAAPSI
jgi:hypothetical protein